ncbi:hypothetical protein, partial [Rufibacter glacialis]|uniref:hypothetical protein n=1 Tax=Rufibacter glacialis TaxID=1259555 RepID=UPI001CEC6AC2
KGLAAKAPVTNSTVFPNSQPKNYAQVVMSETLARPIQALLDKREPTLICTMAGGKPTVCLP